MQGEQAMRRLVRELLQRQKARLIAIGLLLLLNILSFAVIGIFQTPALERKRGTTAEQRKQLDALARGDVTAAYRTARSDLEKIQSRILPKRRFAALLGEIAESSSQCGVTTDSITYKPDFIKDRKLLAYQITMAVSGRYSGVRCFLYEMQTREDLVVVDGFVLKNDDAYKENVSMELKLTAYLRDDA